MLFTKDSLDQSEALDPHQIVVVLIVKHIACGAERRCACRMAEEVQVFSCLLKVQKRDHKNRRKEQ